MSAGSLRNVNSKGKIIYSQAGPKATDGGKDLSKNAKNVIAKWGHNPKPASPHPSAISKDK